MPADSRLPLAPWELEPARQRGMHFGSSGQGGLPEPFSYPLGEFFGLFPSEERPRRRVTQRAPLSYLTAPALGAAAGAPAAIAGLPVDLASLAAMMTPGIEVPAEVPGGSAWMNRRVREALGGGPLGALAEDPGFQFGQEWIGGFADWPLYGKAWKGAKALPRLAAEGLERAAAGEMQGPLGAALSPLAAARLHAVKPRGGQWLRGGNLDEALDELKTGPTREVRERIWPRLVPGEDPRWLRDPVTGMEYEAEGVTPAKARNAWVESNLRRWIEQNLGAPPLSGEAPLPSPVPAQPGITAATDYDAMRAAQRQYGPPRTPWEMVADAAIDLGLTAEDPTGRGVRMRHAELQANPWLAKVPPETPVYDLNTATALNRLGFPHVIDWLEQSGLPPERWKNVSVPEALRQTDLWNQQMAKKMGEAAKKRETAMPVLKEYPVEGQERGWRWVELCQPGDFACESDRMGHSVRGYEPPKGHPDWVKESGNAGSLQYGFNEGWEGIKKGGAKILSLRGPDGKSHVTVEARKVLREDLAGYQPGENSYPEKSDFARLYEEKNGPGSFSELLFDGERKLLTPKQFRDIQANTEDIWDISHWLAVNRPDLVDPSWYTHVIQQIKGPQNAAPAAEALPYVQDLVRNMGPWAPGIGDFHNTGLLRRGGANIPWPRNTSHDIAQKLTQHPDWKKFEESWPELMTEQEAQELIKAFAKEKFPKMKFAAGGPVLPLDDLIASVADRPGLDALLAEMA